MRAVRVDASDRPMLCVCGPDVVCVSVADCCLVMETKLSKSALKEDEIHCKVFYWAARGVWIVEE